MRVEIAVAEGGEGERFPFGDRVDADWRFAVAHDEFDDPDARLQLDEPLIESHQRVVGMGGLRACFVLGHGPDGKGMPLAVVAELAVPAIVLLLERSHVLPVRATSPQFQPSACRSLSFHTLPHSP